MKYLKQLREQAEQELALLTESQTTSVENIQKLIYELDVHQVELRMQNDELQLTQIELAQMRDKYMALYDDAPIGYLTLTANGLIHNINFKASRLLGMDRPALIDVDLRKFIKKKAQDAYHLHIQQVLKSPYRAEVQLEMKQHDGRGFYAHLHSLAVFDEDNSLTHINIALMDISERKKTQRDLQKREQQLKKTVREKDALLKEIHHRVKNNFQMLISLIKLQSRSLPHPVAVEALNDCIKRLRIISELHEILYQSQDFSKISIAPFIKRIVKYVFDVNPLQQIDWTIDVLDQSVDIDFAVSCGLIINELVTNVLKHAFPPDWSGRPELSIEMGSKDKTHDFLCVTDNGVGLLSKELPQTIGLHVVDLFIQKIRGEKIIEQAEGTRFLIIFEKPI